MAHHGAPSKWVSLCEEESSRVHANYFGTWSILGLVAENRPDHLVDLDGVTFAEAARSVGLHRARFPEARREDFKLSSRCTSSMAARSSTQVSIGVADVIFSLPGSSWSSKGEPTMLAPRR